MGRLSLLLATLMALAACNGKGSGGGSSSHDGGIDATTTSHCSVDADCTSQIPQTSPPNCARATCNTVAGTCVFWAKDSDGDGHPRIDCASPLGVPIVIGDDCNDNDPDLYPGHSKSCTTMSDGDAASGFVCVPGQTMCLSDGTQSACTGTVTCVDQACVGMRCQGSCAPGNTQCSGNGIQTCDANGQWGDPAACGVGATCVGKGGAAQCSGSCAAGATLCGGSNGVQTCSSAGTWGEPIPCINQTCTNGTCQGSCSPGQASCAGNVLVTCTNGGQYGLPVDCTSQGDGGQTCVSGGVYGFVTDGGSDAGALPASCQGTCTQWNLFCSGAQPQVCDNTGRPHNFGGVCAGVLPICVNGSCVTCPPGTLQCAGQQHQSCDSNGSWQNDSPACVNQACDVTQKCVGSCTPQTLRCSASLAAVEVCHDDGTWATETPCVSQSLSQTCVTGGLSGSAPTCQGICTYGQAVCNSASNATQTCNAQGNFDPEVACPSSRPFCVVRSDGQGICAACTPGVVTCANNGTPSTQTDGGVSAGTEVALCDSSGTWQIAQCAGACLRGACTVPGTDGGLLDPRSCLQPGPGISNCGPGGSGNESCCASDEVAGGMFYRTYTSDGDGGAQNETDPATISSFRLDRYLVTVGRFRQFVQAVAATDGGAGALGSLAPGAGKHQYLNGSLGLATPEAGTAAPYEPGWTSAYDTYVAPSSTNLSGSSATFTPDAGANENLPINYVNWYEAYAFCIWDGGFLPSQAELEYAQAGGAAQRPYPWGATDPGIANQYAIYGNYFPGSMASTFAAVGTALSGAGAWNQLDLVGDINEWTLDEPTTVLTNPCVDCTYFVPVDAGAPPERVFMGGGYASPVGSIQVPTLHPASQGGLSRIVDVGFRCARAP